MIRPERQPKAKCACKTAATFMFPELAGRRLPNSNFDYNDAGLTKQASSLLTLLSINNPGHLLLFCSTDPHVSNRWPPKRDPFLLHNMVVDPSGAVSHRRAEGMRVHE